MAKAVRAAAGVTEEDRDLLVGSAVVREMADEEAMAALAVENLQRKDLTAVEEAASVRRMLEAGLSKEAVARATGKSVRWVYRRASILNASERWLKLAGKIRLSAAFLERLARLPADMQDQAWVDAGADDVEEGWEEDSRTAAMFGRGGGLAELENVISEMMLEIATAPWAGWHPEWCGECVCRTDRKTDLFDAAETERPCCLDRGCWSRMQERWLSCAEKDLGAAHGACEVIRSESYWRFASERTEENSVPMLVRDGYNAGAVRWGKSREAAAECDDGGGRAGPTKRQKAMAAEIRAVAGIIEAAEWPEFEFEGTRVAVGLPTLLALAVGVGLRGHVYAPKGIPPYAGAERYRAVAKVFAAGAECAGPIIWRAVRPELLSAIKFESVSCCQEVHKRMVAIKDILGIPDGMVSAMMQNGGERKAKR
jgi:hypothetical protein